MRVEFGVYRGDERLGSVTVDKLDSNYAGGNDPKDLFDFIGCPQLKPLIANGFGAGPATYRLVLEEASSPQFEVRIGRKVQRAFKVGAFSRMVIESARKRGPKITARGRVETWRALEAGGYGWGPAPRGLRVQACNASNEVSTRGDGSFAIAINTRRYTGDMPATWFGLERVKDMKVAEWAGGVYRITNGKVRRAPRDPGGCGLDTLWP